MTECVDIGGATLYYGNCLAVMPLIGRVSHVIADPPYEKEAHSANRILGYGRRREMRERALNFDAMTPEERGIICLQVANRCNGWFLAFCQAEAVALWRSEMERAGMAWRRAMVWVKPDSSPQLSGDRPAQGYESIAAAWCGSGRSVWSGGGRRGVFTFVKHDAGCGHGGKRNQHPTQKPVSLMNELVSLFSKPGDVVLDPYMGSGTTGVACVGLGRKFIGIEKDRRYFDLACERIARAQDQMRLFDEQAQESMV